MIISYLAPSGGGVDECNFLAEKCERQGITIAEYVGKLAKQGTVVYKQIDGKIVSVVVGYSSDSSFTTSYIAMVYTLKEYRGKHIARELMAEYMDYCKSVGLKGCWLTTRENNDSAIKLYQSLGFTICNGYYNEERKVLKLERDFRT